MLIGYDKVPPPAPRGQIMTMGAFIQSTMAVVAAGYADGYSRHLSNAGQVCLHGRRAPIRGRVCMQMTLVDVTHIPEAKPGDDAWLLGGEGDGAITCHDLAAWWGTITYEVFCVLGRLNPRVYV